MTKFTKGKARDEFRAEEPSPPRPPPPAPPSTTTEQEQIGQHVAEFYATLVNTSRKPWASTNEGEDEEHAHAATGLGFPAEMYSPTASSEKELRRNNETKIAILQPPHETQYLEPAEPVPRLTENDKITVTIALPKSNIGYKLLEKAGWSGEGGIGAREQGRVEPIQPDIRQGNVGLGFETKKRKKDTHKNLIKKEDSGAVGGKFSKNRKSSVLSLPRDELADEDIETKVKRVKQVMQAEADEKAGKELARLVYSAFRDGDGGGSGGGGTTDVNPLLRKNRKLSARNPLL